VYSQDRRSARERSLLITFATQVPYYQPVAALALFQRTLQGFATADGDELTATTATNGTAKTTHTASFVPLPSSSASSDDAGGSMTSSASAALNTTMPDLNRYNYKAWW
jgi:hypothetical protein